MTEGTKEQILVVDDDEELCEVLKVALVTFGYEPHTEQNTAGAKKWLLANPQVTLIISDIMMPDGNGLDFCKWVRTEKTLEKVPIIMCTGLKDDETMNDALELGAVDFLRKPMSMASLKEKINRLKRRAAGK